MLDERFDAVVTITDENPDVTLSGGIIQAEEEPDDDLVDLLQVANQQLDADAPPPLRLETTEPIDPDRDAKAAVAFFTILILYGQLLTYGYWVAAGVVEEKSSRVIEVLLATIRPKDLLAGKVIGLGLLGLGQILLIAVLGLAAAAVTGALDIDGDLLGAVALSVVWFLLGYAFYAAAFAVAGALVPRQEELQSSTTPLTMLILISLFAGFIVTGEPGGDARARLCVHPDDRADHDAGPDHPRRRSGVGDRRLGGGDDRRHHGPDPAGRSDLRGGRAAHRIIGETFRSASTGTTVKGPEADSKLSGGTAL